MLAVSDGGDQGRPNDLAESVEYQYQHCLSDGAIRLAASFIDSYLLEVAKWLSGPLVPLRRKLRVVRE